MKLLFVQKVHKQEMCCGTLFIIIALYVPTSNAKHQNVAQIGLPQLHSEKVPAGISVYKVSLQANEPQNKLVNTDTFARAA